MNSQPKYPCCLVLARPGDGRGIDNVKQLNGRQPWERFLAGERGTTENFPCFCGVVAVAFAASVLGRTKHLV